MAYQPPISLTNAPEHALIREMAAGNSGALDELYARFGPPVFGFLMARLGNRQLAEEVQQDVMLAAWQSAHQFRGESKVMTWLLTIARNKAINARRRRELPQVSLADTADPPAEDTGPLDRLVRQGECEAVRSMLDQLPAHLREVLVLVFYHQLSESEVSGVLGIAPGTVKSRLHRAKAALRDVLQGEGRL